MYICMLPCLDVIFRQVIFFYYYFFWKRGGLVHEDHIQNLKKKHKFDFVSHVYLCTPALIKKKTFRLGVYDHSHKHTIALFFFGGGGHRGRGFGLVLSGLKDSGLNA